MKALRNQVVIITGAASGLGKETAIEFVKAGAQVAICGRSSENIKAVESELLDICHPNRVLAMRADVSTEEDVQQFVNATISKFGRIDTLINNAAIFENYSIVDSSIDSWYHHIDNNVTSAFLMMRECIPFMRENKFGRIISITSELARHGAAGFGAYSASKAALETLTSSVNDEEYHNGISTILFNPGVMKTGLHSYGEDPKTIAPALVRLAYSNKDHSDRVVTIDDLQVLEA
ncbi:SDR family NAD(P)-dependent oxidoreductase [Desertibacillus haloalkaliphilus]|uniref:SDR family NAD(P)-dependent oxidoreductase n=1 Tax=Desertibacillus haloalkaliphilus TaxID=1328930 RepID=UPI001C25F6C4|nr:SDR family oxidoreductase [Desertibacillus haloalkaliphilus]MBU8905013.1 SDR family oxidoreductase [Desertibacillus haloalkaliphilus]